MPLFVITGASCAGKSTMCEILFQNEKEYIVMESDILWNQTFDTPEDDYRASCLATKAVWAARAADSACLASRIVGRLDLGFCFSIWPKAGLAMRHMRYGFVPALLLVFLVLSGCLRDKPEVESARAENGTMNLTGWDFASDGNVNLDGQWEFYWNRLIAPGEFGAAGSPTGCYNVPQYWTRYSGLNLPSTGYATYRLVVRTDGSTHYFGIRIPEVYTEYGLWINGELVDSSGSFAGTSATYLRPGACGFYAEGAELEIVLQIRNSTHVYGGIGQSFRLGTTYLINRESNFRSAVDLLLFGICLSAGVYHLILSIFRKGPRETLWFCAFCLAVCIRTLLSNETLLTQAFPHLPFSAGSRLATLTIPLCVIFMMRYIRTLYREDMSGAASNLLLTIHICYALFVLVASPLVYSSAFFAYLYSVGAACLLGLHVSVRAVLNRRRESVYFLVGVVFLVMGATVDTLNFLQIISTGYILSAALSAFIVVQAVLLAKRYSDAYRSVEQLSKDLKASLNRTTNAETAFLHAQMKPHFLYNALNTIAECCQSDPGEAERLVLSLSKYLRGTLDFENLGGLIPLKKELDLVRAYVAIEKARFRHVDVQFEVDDRLLSVYLPPLTLQPLVENAIKHGLRNREGGSVAVRIAKLAGSIHLLVEDNGAGMDRHKLGSLLDSPSGSTSIGLYNIHTRLQRLYGKGLVIRSSVEAGTSVSFEIPFEEET